MKYLVGALVGAVVTGIVGYLGLAWYFRNTFRG